MNDAAVDFHLIQAQFTATLEISAPAPGEGIAIADKAALEAALATARGGEVLNLAPGNYDGLGIGRKFDPPLTIRGNGQARFSDIGINSSHHDMRGGGVILDGIDAEGIWISSADGVVVFNSSARQLKASRSTGIHIERNRLHDGHFPLRIEHSSDFQVIGNVMERAREDTMRISGDSFDGVVRGNAFLDNRAAKPMHGDHLQIFGIRGQDMAPHDLTIEQNLMHDNANGKQVFHFKDGNPERDQNWRAGTPGTPAPAQGVFVVSGQKTGYRNVTVRRNLLRLSMTNSIFIASGKENYLIEENIVVPIPGQQLAAIRLLRDRKNSHWTNEGVIVTRNITSRIIDDTPEAAVTNDNFVFGENLNGLFAGISGNTGGENPEDYRLAPGSPVPAPLVDTWLEPTIAVLRQTLDQVPEERGG